MNAEIITIGDELLIGQVIDTNSTWIAQQLGIIGVKLHYKSSISDNKEAILTSLHDAELRSDIIIITGGLGPTKDDITKATLCEYFNTHLVQNEKVLEWVQNIFKYRKQAMLEINNMQAMVPANCDVLWNKNGTAPGMWFENNNKIFISMPGVPFEMKAILNEEVIPKLKIKLKLPSIFHRTLQTVSIGESYLANKIETIEISLPKHIKLAYLPSIGAVRLRFSAYGDNLFDLETEVDVYVQQVYKVVGDFIFGEGDDSLTEVVGTLLKDKSQTISTAESCTGGYLGHMLTSVAGSSSYYMGSIISYANYIKTQELGVSDEILNTNGAVSKECVVQMANAIRLKMNTHFGVATSGIAGPDGGTIDKPVGTVWIAIASERNTVSQVFNFGDNRERTIHRTGLMALDMLRKILIKS
ncbi:MAG: competence/damage-inducible protein A [Bacteroidetes bacterium]|nr:competence/damage-inducible protein A [Bacteroidota bacterium]